MFFRHLVTRSEDIFHLEVIGTCHFCEVMPQHLTKMRDKPQRSISKMRE
jgi:hypothetical protein